MKEDILGIRINQETKQEILQSISKSIKRDQQTRIVTPNPEMVMVAQEDYEFKTILNNAAIAIPDGKGLIWAAKILGKKLDRTVTGIDLMQTLCKKAAEKRWNIFLLGGENGVVKKVKDRLEIQIPGLKIIGCLEDSPYENDDLKTRQKILSLIDSKRIDLLFVAYGAPKQEKWIARNIGYLPVKIAMGVGGAFDYLSGRIRRAPLSMRKIGLEWLFRLLNEPWRWRRQLRLLKFVWLICLERLKK